MNGNLVLRRVAQAVVVLCAVGCVAVAITGDWPDAGLVGLAGALAMVTARMTTWKLRHSSQWVMVATAPRDGNS